jgi:regulator of PEP synthase PpsR (kinase-PPPase family)
VEKILNFSQFAFYRGKQPSYSSHYSQGFAEIMSPKKFHLHLVSDATGETLDSVVKATLAQFSDAEPVKHFWPMIRTARQMERVVEDIAEHPGLIMYTMVNKELRNVLERAAKRMDIPTISVLDPIIQSMTVYLGEKARGQPGRQHTMDDAYFKRIEAMQFTLAHDDGQLLGDVEEADIVLVGVSRTSKTPTSMYLANRGFKTANYPLVPEVPVPELLMQLRDPFVVGLTTSPDRLEQIRKNRLLALQDGHNTTYVNPERIKEELSSARRLFTKQQWPVIDVTRRSIEETAAAVINLYNKRKEERSS